MLVGCRETENTIAVLFGGRSSEHEVSLRSALFVLQQMPSKYQIIPVGINRSGTMWSLEGTFTSKDFQNFTEHDLAAIVEGKKTPHSRSSPISTLLLPYRREAIANLPEIPGRIINLEVGVFLPILHGTNGEDGRFQGLFELAEMPYVGCDSRASVIGIDKNIQKIMARDAGINVAKYELVELEEFMTHENPILDRMEMRIGYPCFVKPNSLGSAVGVNRAKNKVELSAAIRFALRFDRKILVEEAMVGTEVECAFLGSSTNPRITVAGEIAPDDFYSYDAKYNDANAAKLFLPARLTTPRMQELRAMAAKLARVLGLEGLCRIDFWNCTNPERFVFNEINTIPGMTNISMFPKLWEHEGVLAPKWLEEVIEQAKVRNTIWSELSVAVNS